MSFFLQSRRQSLLNGQAPEAVKVVEAKVCSSHCCPPSFPSCATHPHVTCDRICSVLHPCAYGATCHFCFRFALGNDIISWACAAALPTPAPRCMPDNRFTLNTWLTDRLHCVQLKKDAVEAEWQQKRDAAELARKDKELAMIAANSTKEVLESPWSTEVRFRCQSQTVLT